MSPGPTTIVLNRTLNHSITYNPSNDCVTAHLPSSKPIERVQNRLKLMILIYFVQLDAERKSRPRKLDGEVSMEIHIVERIIWQFSNYAQAMRSLREYTEVGDHIDTSSGTEPTRVNRNATGTSRAPKMTITQEVRDTLVEWLKDILFANVSQGPSIKSDRRTKQQKKEIIDLSSPDPETTSVVQVIPRPSQKRKHPTLNENKLFRERGVLTPGSSPLSLASSPRPQASDKFQRLFPSSPMDQIVPCEDPPAVVKVNDTSKLRTLGKESSDRTSISGVSDSGSDIKGKIEDFVGMGTDDMRTIMGKISSYARHLYSHARKGGTRKVMKYSRKLKKLTERIQKQERY